MNDERHKSFLTLVDDLNRVRGEIVKKFGNDNNYAGILPQEVLDTDLDDRIINNWRIDKCRVIEDEMEELVNNIMRLVPNGFKCSNDDVRAFNNMLDEFGREQFKYASNELKEYAKYLRDVGKIKN